MTKERWGPSKFRLWYEWYGPRDFKEQLGITRGTIHCWFYRDSFPTVRLMKEIIELSENKLTYDDIIEGLWHEKARSQRRKKLKDKTAPKKK